MLSDLPLVKKLEYTGTHVLLVGAWKRGTVLISDTTVRTVLRTLKYSSATVRAWQRTIVS